MPNAIDELLTESDAYYFDEDSGEFLLSDGSEPDDKDRLAILLLLLLLGRRRAEGICESFATDEITLNEWHAEMIALIKSLYLAAAVIAYGSLSVVEASHLPAVELLVEDQLKYLNRFSDQIANENYKIIATPLTVDSAVATTPKPGAEAAPGFVNRSQLYVHSAYAAYQKMNRDRKATEGVLWEKRILNAAESCDDCIAAASLSWQPEGTLPEIGDSQCNVNCRCEFIYSESATEPDDSED